ncbi:alpha/beta fold hydrolase [Embleya scabrispora]|uniref:alpha/beta fold hydrolase n=1 Tax=Embleya scabrispora TaxID=159449 RepID=UPI00036EEC34|nr:alpha/beta hydrolase [Embleya scabrispora]MYS85128.1 alpha/beta fold hydrolase [Streptomyces sp. SID5474]
MTADPGSLAIRRGYADTAFGQVHYAECGSGPPVVLLHQTPRSWDEYREVLSPLGHTHRAIAMDTIGFGASAPVVDHSIETYAAAVLAFFDALGLPRAALVGHHTGGVIAVEVTAAAPERVERLVLSSTPYIDAEARRRRKDLPPIDLVEVDPNGTHLGELWGRRQGFYPPGRPDLLTRFIRDALVHDPADLEAGHEAVGRYRMEERIGRIGCRVLCIGATADPYAFPELQRLRAHLPGADIAVVDGGMVPLMEEHPSEVAELIARFLTDA